MRPDQLVLTFSGDPRTSMAVSWRQSVGGTTDRVELQSPDPGPSRTVNATCRMIDSREWLTVENDTVIQRCTANLTDLSADTEYTYRPSDRAHPNAAGAWNRFRTAPDPMDSPVTFLYLGDVQKGIEEWSSRYQAAVDRHPEVRFTIQVGDLVNVGARRTEYDDVLGGAAEAFATVPFVPVLGNHEYVLGGETLFQREFSLSGDGPSGSGHCRAFDYGPVRVVVLDSSSEKTLAAQAAWLAARLDESQAPWKVVVFHHPVWPPRSWFAGSDVRDAWMATLEGHGAHLVLNGHDHSYARTFPLRDGQPAQNGTVYVVSVAGSKFYKQGASPRIAKGLDWTSTYQVITASPDRLVLSTRTWDGIEVDHLILSGSSPPR
jgi:hypothetical protein